MKKMNNEEKEELERLKAWQTKQNIGEVELKEKELEKRLNNLIGGMWK